MGELLDTITDKELMEWAEIYQEEPFGEFRSDVRSAQICSLLANINRDSKKRPTPYEISDFLLYHSKPQKKQSVEDMRKVLMGLVKE